MDKIFETNSCFHVKTSFTTGKVQFLFFRGFFLLLTKFSFWEEDRVLYYNSMKTYNFPDNPEFPTILGLKLIGNSWGNSYIPCLLLIITLSFICAEKKNWKNIKKISKYCDQDCLQNFFWKSFNTKLGHQWKDWISNYLVQQIFKLFWNLVALILGWNCVTRVTKIVKRVWSGLGQVRSQKLFHRQSWTKYLRQTLFFMWNGVLRENFNFYLFTGVLC